MGDRFFQRTPALRGLLGLLAAVAVGLMVFILPSGPAGFLIAAGGSVLAGLVLIAKNLITLRRNQGDLQQIQGHLNSGLNLFGDRLADHDLMLLDLADRMDQIQTRIGTLETLHSRQRKQDREVLMTLAGKVMALVRMATARPPDTAPANNPSAPPKKKGESRSAPIQKRATQTPFLHTPAPAANDEDWAVSPSLIREGLRQVIETRRTDLYIQPITRLPGRTVFGYEISGRLRVQPGLYVPARLYRPLAESGGQMESMDTLVVDELIRTAQKRALPATRIFVNLSARSLTNGQVVTKLGRLGYDLRQTGTTLVLEIAQSGLEDMGEGPARILRELQNLGLECSLNDVTNPRIDLARLQDLGFSYLKLPVATLIAGSAAGGKMKGAEAILDRFLSRAKACGLTVIASQIEDPADLIHLLDHPVGLGQGYLFGRPDRPIAYPGFAKAA